MPSKSRSGRKASGSAPLPNAGTRATISNHIFLGNISEYFVTLPSGLTLRVQTHPLQHFKVGAPCTVEVDATLCTVFRAGGGEANAA